MGARVCRACYTVLAPSSRKIKIANSRGVRFTLVGLEYMFILSAVALGLWIFRADLDALASGGKSYRDFLEPPFYSGTNFSEATSDTSKQHNTRSGVRHNLALGEGSVVVASGGSCSIRQGVRNLTQEPVSQVTLRFTFRDAIGQVLGAEVEATTDAVLSPGVTRSLEFQVRCPEPQASVEVRIPKTKSGGVPTIELVDGVPETSAASAPSSAESEVAVVVSDPTVCPEPDPCELEVDIDSGRTAYFLFYRDPAARELLISNDSILAAHLRARGTATLNLPLRSGERVAAPLGRRNLRESEQRGLVSSWLAKLF